MNSKRYISALIHYEKGSHLSVDNEVLISVIAPTAGILIGVGINAVGSYLEKRRQKKLNSPGIIPVTVNSNGNNSNLFRKTLYRVTPTVVVRSVILVYEKLASSQSLRIAASSSFKVIDVIIIVRSIVLSRNLLRYIIRTRENFVMITFNTLCWIVSSEERDTMINLAFAVVILLTAKLWCTKNRLAQRLLRIWVFITLLNLSNYIYVSSSLLNHRPSDIGVFGLPRVEHTIKQLDVFTENARNSKISMLGKEEPFVLSSPIKNETLKDTYNDVELEINRMIKNETLGEENIVFSKKEGLQKGKISRTNFTSKSKRRMNSLQELNQANDNVTSLPIENDVEKVNNTKRIQAEKVQ